MADGPDVIKFDPGLGRIYAACYSGAISIFHQDDPDHYSKIEDFKVQHAVHSIAIDLWRLTGCTRRSRKRTENPRREWLCMKR